METEWPREALILLARYGAQKQETVCKPYPNTRLRLWHFLLSHRDIFWPLDRWIKLQKSGILSLESCFLISKAMYKMLYLLAFPMKETWSWQEALMARQRFGILNLELVLLLLKDIMLTWQMQFLSLMETTWPLLHWTRQWRYGI